mmetsp:Transcript_82632/g.191994  ORF Transcript_82632/g.191994 Transcript_82632/m.191994 type:complete len:804 (+) Transcript_82632:47-2458(+)
MAVFRFIAACLLLQCDANQFACSSTTDSLNKGLRTVTASWLNEDFCEYSEQTNSVENLMGSCESFCGNGNIPYLVGLPSFGFNLSDLDRICINEGDQEGEFLKYDEDLMDKCKGWSGSLDTILHKAADFVAAVDNMTYAQLQFRMGMNKSVQELVNTIGSEETKRLVMRAATPADLLPTYMGALQSHLDEFFGDGRMRRSLQDVMEVLRDAGVGLQQALKTHLPQVKKYFEQCETPLLALTDQRQYLLDLCVQLTPNCLGKDIPSARHVGCCCGTVPVAGSFKISGETGARRRLEQDHEESRIDVCGEAHLRAKADLDRRRAALEQDPFGKELLQKYEEGLRERYPDFYSRCQSERRLVKEDAPVMGSRPGRPKVTAAGRRMAQLTTCEPKPVSVQLDETLRAAFWKDTEREICGNMMSTDGMVGVCQAFCGKNAVPLLIGSTSFGFNQSAMDSVCVAGNPIQASAEKVAKCHDNARAMHKVQVETASLVSKLQVLAAENLRFEAKVKTTVEELKVSIKTKATAVLEDATVGQKLDALRSLLADETKQIGEATELYLRAATNDVEAAGEALEAELTTALSALEELVTQCNIFTGVGPSKEYLLDICSQTSKECMDVQLGRHAGCCCGYLPLLELGLESITAHTIPGLSDTAILGTAASQARVAAPARRVEETASYHMCAASWQMSRPQVEAAEKSVIDLGYGSMVTNAKNAFNARYRGYGCGEPPRCEKETGGTCRIFSCSSSRGMTDCVDGQCVCSEGTCLLEGACREPLEGTTSKAWSAFAEGSSALSVVMVLGLFLETSP